MAPFSNIDNAVFCESDDDCSLDSSSVLTPPLLARKNSSLSDASSISSKTSSSVSFAPEVAVYAILHINDYSLLEKHDCWYSPEESHCMRQEWKDIVQQMERLNTVADDKNDEDVPFCVRGLEGKTLNGKRRRREARALAMEVVLDEQLYQQLDDEDGFNPIMMAMAYHEVTFKLQLEANEQAQRDAQAVGQQCCLLDKPKKFDFRAVRAKYFASSGKSDRGNRDDATLPTTLLSGTKFTSVLYVTLNDVLQS